MASIYKRTQGKTKKRSVWYIGWTNHQGKRQTAKGFTDRGQTEQLAAKLENEAMLRKRGLIDPELEKVAERRKAPLKQHLETFKRSLLKNSPKHVSMMMSRVRKIVDGCEFKTVAEINTEAVEGFLQDFAVEEDIGNRTYNHYVQAIDAFCNWMVATKRINVNPLTGLARLNNEVDVRHRRRALTPEEFGKLVDSARMSGISIQCYDGETRARIYTVSYMTGLRRSEIASLTPDSFDLASEQATVTVEAVSSKHRRRDVLPLHPKLVVMLREWLAGLKPSQVIFPKLGQRRTWLMVKLDLERVGIAYKTKEGIADFHAAGRHTHITELLRNGASLPEAKELARHTDIKMTMKYTHIGISDQARALGQLPWTDRPELLDPEKTEPTRNVTPNEDEKSWERSGSEPGVSDCHIGARGDIGESLPSNDTTPVGDRGCRELSSPDDDRQKWRRRESNPRPAIDPRKLLRV